MGKHGPCLHCGIHSTPLWRNGPPEKPVLCNACGSRYRSGKPLENYRPKAHNIGPKKKRKAVVESSSNSSSGYYASSESSPSHYPNSVTVKQETPDDNPVENWRSSWRIHSRKRSRVVYRGLTTIQKLQRDLHNILRDEFNGSEPGGAEDVLINNINTNKLQIPPTEIGLGATLLNFPLPSADHQNQQQTRVSPPDHQNQQQTRVSPPNQPPTASS